jgi:hypothetical protein
MRAAAGVLASVVAASLLAPGAARARIPPPLVRCGCDPAALVRFHDEIASAQTLAEAQQRAAPPVELARSALARARRLTLDPAGLAEKERQLRQGELAIAAATTPAAVADAFAIAVTGSPVLAGVDIDPPGCSYSTWEIVAIVLGFILGVIPGIILLIILC